MSSLAQGIRVPRPVIGEVALVNPSVARKHIVRRMLAVGYPENFFKLCHVPRPHPYTIISFRIQDRLGSSFVGWTTLSPA
jgi:hypothetical protein